MKYVVSESFVDVIGRLWDGSRGMTRYTVSRHDIDVIEHYGGGQVTREAVEKWLQRQHGDFHEIVDFHADIEHHGNVVIPWNDEESEYEYLESTE